MEQIKQEEIQEFIKNSISETIFQDVTYYCGGCVRDEILGLQPKDIDLLIDLPDGGIQLAEYLCKTYPTECKNLVIYPRFKTAKLSCLGNDIEMVCPRKEVYPDDNSRKCDTEIGTILQDAQRRDLTINALFKSVTTGEILDLTENGLNDIKNRIIRTPLNPDIILEDDPLRQLRIIRFAHKYGFKINDEVIQGLKKNNYRLSIISIERINDEFSKMLLLYKPSQCIRMLCDLGLMEYIIPEINQLIGLTQNKYHKWDVFGHTMNVLDNVEPVLELRLAALLHDIGKINTKTINDTGVHFYKHELESAIMAERILRKLKYPNDIIKTVVFLTKEHMRTKQFGNDCSNVKDKSIRKLVDQVGHYRDLLLQLINADNVSHSDESNMPDQVYNFQLKIDELELTDVYKIELPINGNDIMEEFNLEPSSIIKDCLSYIRKLCYSKPNLTKEEALKNCKNLLNNEKIK